MIEKIRMKKKWITDKVVNDYCKEYLALQDKTWCQGENGRKLSWFISFFFFKICLMRRMLMQHFVGGTIMKTFLDGRRRHLGITISTWRTCSFPSILIINIWRALWFTWRKSISIIMIHIEILARIINIWRVLCGT